MQKIRAVVFAFLGAALAVAAGSAVAGENLPVVVELFTSQGCNSCPPADAFLEELAKRDDVIALAFHVNYWDYLGWKDTFATDETTERQRTYATFLGERTVYTPQMVIGGVAHKVGSRRGDVNQVIDSLRQPSDPYLEVRVGRVEGGKIAIHIPAGELEQRDVVVWLVRYDSSHVVDIERGENRGLAIEYRNVVADYRELAMWYGEEIKIELKISELRAGGHDGSVILVQEGGSGRIIGAAKVDLDAI
jgi:hypothetical protein